MACTRNKCKFRKNFLYCSCNCFTLENPPKLYFSKNLLYCMKEIESNRLNMSDTFQNTEKECINCKFCDLILESVNYIGICNHDDSRVTVIKDGTKFCELWKKENN